MNPRELYHRSVVLPLDSLACVRLEARDVDGAMKVEVVSLEKNFSYIFTLLNDLNRVCGTNIEEREVSEIDVERVFHVSEYLRVLPRNSDESLMELRAKMIALCDRAIALHMPLFVVL